MSIDLQYGNVSPARYPNPGRKRKSTKSSQPAGKKKKKEEKEHDMNDILVNMGLSDPSPEDCDPVVREVVKETRAAVDEMMKELKDMVDQTTQTPPPPPQFTVTTVYDNEEAFSEAKALNRERKVNPPSSVDYMVCPCHEVRLEARQSQKGWPYVKCPMQPFCCFVGKTKPLTI